MRGLFFLVILIIGGVAMMRERIDNKKYPDTFQARQARQDKLFREIEKMEKRYGKHSEQAQIARQRFQDGK